MSDAPEFAHESFAAPEGQAEAIERVWREFWLPALRDEHGRISLPKLKAELYDCHHLIMEAPQVYRHVTGGISDDPCASAEGIIALADEHVRRLTEGLAAARTRRPPDTDADAD